MKKVVSFIMAIMLCFTVCGCSNYGFKCENCKVINSDDNHVKIQFICPYCKREGDYYSFEKIIFDVEGSFSYFYACKTCGEAFPFSISK